MRKKSKLVHGVGINDADYPINPRVNGKQITCEYYLRWKSMIQRCYDPKYQKKRPTYIGCSVVKEWHYFMAFRAWMQTQDWVGNALDKDLLVEGNRVYSPITCIFVSMEVNSLLTDRAACRGELPLGVSWYKSTGKYLACCADGTGSSKHLGYFADANQAHQAYRIFKKKHILKIANKQTNTRVRDALIRRSDSI